MSSFASFFCDQADDPNIGFGDLGRRLGEMWHALEENEKEDYRRRARLIMLIMLLFFNINLYPGTWRTRRCAPGRNRWLPCQGTDSSRLRGCRLCNNDVVAEVVFVDFIVVIVVFGDE